MYVWKKSHAVRHRAQLLLPRQVPKSIGQMYILGTFFFFFFFFFWHRSISTHGEHKGAASLQRTQRPKKTSIFVRYGPIPVGCSVI